MVRILEGTIIDVNSSEYTCHVRARGTNGEGYALENVPLLSKSVGTDTWAGSTDIPERLSPCLVLKIDTRYYVMDVAPLSRNLNTNPPVIDKNKSITLTTDDNYTPESHKTLPPQGSAAERKFMSSSRANRPHDALPGDKFWRTREGGFMGILRGGLILAKAGEFCQLMMSRIDALFRLVSRNIQIFTDWGRIDILNDKGNTNMSLKVGANYSDNKQGDFTVHLDVGSTGDLVRLKVTGVGGIPMASAQIYPSGRIEVISLNSIYVNCLGSSIDMNILGEVKIKSGLGNLYLN